MTGTGRQVAATFTRVGLAALVIVGGISLWTVLPIVWLQLTGGLAPGARFVLVIIGLPLSMGAWFVLLSCVEGYRTRLRGGERTPLLEVTLVASAVASVICLVLWWAFFAESADPSGPLQPI